MQMEITLNGQKFVYDVYLSGTPSAAALFTRLQYGSTIDGERHELENHLAELRSAYKVQFYINDDASRITVNRVEYKLPNFIGAIAAPGATYSPPRVGFSYVEPRYNDGMTDKAKAKIAAEVEPQITAWLAEHGAALRADAFAKWFERVKSGADHVQKQCAKMVEVAAELMGARHV